MMHFPVVTCTQFVAASFFVAPAGHVDVNRKFESGTQHEVDCTVVRGELWKQLLNVIVFRFDKIRRMPRFS